MPTLPKIAPAIQTDPAIPRPAAREHATIQPGEGASLTPADDRGRRSGLLVGQRRLFGLFFVLSGAASLIYQTVWQRLLSLHYGVGAVSSIIVVSIFMLGLGAGSLLGGRLAERFGARVGLYLIVEVAIGLFGLASLPFLDRLAAHTAGSSYLISSACILAFLLVPTLLMGTTLPIAVKILSASEPNLLDNLSFFYFVNTLGAAGGALLSTYVVVSFVGLDRAVYVAVAINIGLGFSLLLFRRNPAAPRELAAVEHPPTENLGRWAYPTSFATGFLAIGYQIVWFRLVGTILKDSPYAFSTILGIYLLGIARGSHRLHRRARTRPASAPSFADLYFGVNGSIALYSLLSVSLFALVSRLSPLSELLANMAAARVFPVCDAGPSSCLFSFASMILWPAVFMWIPANLMGMSFPLATHLSPRDGARPASAAASMYAVNVLGNVLGGIVTGFLLIPLLGSERVLLAFGLAGLLFFLFVRRVRGHLLRSRTRMILVGAIAAAALLAFPGPSALFKAIDAPPSAVASTFFEEGVEASVLTYQDGLTVRNYINGNIHGVRPYPVFVEEGLQTMAHARNPSDVLVIGFGTGTLMEVSLLDERVRKLTLIEISAALLKNVRKLPVLATTLSDPRVTIVVEDARRHLLGASAKYDVILMDPLRSGSAYSNNLYSVEFFQLLASHLNPGGLLLVWLDDYGVLPRTVATVFSHTTLFDCGFLLASDTAQEADTARYQLLSQRFTGPATHLSCAPSATREQILAHTSGLPVNRSFRPVTEYFLGAQGLGYKTVSVLKIPRRALTP